MIPTVAPYSYTAPPPSRAGFDTPEPLYVAEQPIRITDQPDTWTFDEKQRVRTAANMARQRYPGPVGDLVCAELLQWAEYGWRLAPGGRVMQVVEQLLAP